MSDTNLAGPIIIKEKSMSDCEVKICVLRSQLIGSDAVARRTDFDTIMERCLVSERNLACSVLFGQKALPGGEVKVCLLA